MINLIIALLACPVPRFFNGETMSDIDLDSSPGIARFTPPRVLFGCFVLALAIEFALPARFAGFDGVPATFRTATGVCLFVAGFLFMMFGHGRFVKAGTTIKTKRAASTLITAGTYRFSRNPMYVGFVAILVGVGIAANSLVIVLAAVPFFLYLDRYVIAREEGHLRLRFGGDYEDYCKKVRRWL